MVGKKERKIKTPYQRGVERGRAEPNGWAEALKLTRRCQTKDPQKGGKTTLNRWAGLQTEGGGPVRNTKLKILL